MCKHLGPIERLGSTPFASVGEFGCGTAITKMNTGKLAIRSLAAAILAGAIAAAAFYWLEGSAQSIAGVEGGPSEHVWGALLCRAPLYTQKAKGGLSDF